MVIISGIQPLGAHANPSTAPNDVTNLSGLVTTNDITLTFEKPSPTPSDYSHANIYRDSVFNKLVTGTVFNESGLPENTGYMYRITTEDTYGNESVGVTYYAATAIANAVIESGLLDTKSLQSITYTGATGSLTSFYDNQFNTNVHLINASGRLDFEFFEEQDINELYINYSGLSKPTITFFSAGSSNLGSMTLENGMTAFPNKNGVKSIRINTSTSSSIHELELFGPAASVPEDVTNLQETHGETTVNLTWGNPAIGTWDYFDVYRDGFIVGSNISGNAFNDTNLGRGKTYSYRVVSVNGAGSSPGVFINSTTNGRLHINVPNVNPFANVILDGTRKKIVTSFSGDFSLEDTTNAGSGWRVTIEATRFQQVGGGGGLVFPIGSLVLNTPSAINPANGTVSTLPIIMSNGPWVIDSGGATKIITANIGEGMGEFTMSMPVASLELTIPEDVPLIEESSGTVFESTLTFNIVNGP